MIVVLEDIINDMADQQMMNDIVDRLFLVLVSNHLDEYNQIVNEAIDSLINNDESVERLLKARPELLLTTSRENIEKSWADSKKDYHASLHRVRLKLLKDLEWSVFAKEEYQYFLSQTPKEKHIHTRADAHKRQG